MTHKIAIVGERGMVSRKLQEALKDNPDFEVVVISTDIMLSKHFRDPYGISTADLAILCVQELKSAEVFARLPKGIKVLDISPEFRCDDDWTYGLPEILGEYKIHQSTLVANPGCFATSAVLLLRPVIDLYPQYASQNFYLDGVGGYTTGGSKMIEKYESGKAVESVYSLHKEHLHIKEIKKHCGMIGDVIFTPKISNFPQGIRMQVYIPVMLDVILKNIYRSYYRQFDNIIINDHNNFGISNIPADEMAGTDKVNIRIYQKGSGCIAVATMDNLGKGAVDSALHNIKLMLG